MSTMIPTMTSMVAPGGSYLAQPAMTSMYMGGAPASMYTPVAAPTMAAPSYVAPPVGPAFGVPPPTSLTAGLVPPPTVTKEAAAYHKAIDAQLNKQATAVYEEAKIKQQMLQQQAASAVEAYKLGVEEKLAMMCLKTDQDALTQVSGLKEAAITQQTSLEEMAAVAIGEFNKKKAMEDMAAQSYALQKKWYDDEMKLAAAYQQVAAKGMQQGLAPPMTTAAPMMPMTTAAPMMPYGATVPAGWIQ